MKIGLLSLGCPKNLVDGEVMLGLAEQAGHEITADAREADVLVVNTCAFIDSAKQESIDAILEMAGHRRDGRCRRLVVTGCLAERYRDELRAEMPEIDVVLGTGEVPDIVRALDNDARSGRLKPAPTETGRVQPVSAESLVAPLRCFGKLSKPIDNRQSSIVNPSAPSPESRRLRSSSFGEPAVALSAFARSATARPRRSSKSGVGAEAGVPSPGVDQAKLPTYLYDADTPRHLTTPKHFAYVKVAEGCDYTCSFCIIPTLRGHYRSRPEASIVREAESLAARGVRELLLVSQDTTFYGVDRGERGALARLLRALDRVDGLTWIRLLYLYPTTITDEVLGAMAECDTVCRYIDLPLQHASAAVLTRMRRPGTRRTYERLLQRIRDRVPGVTLRTTFIVGFPGETEADVAELESFVRDIEFDHIGVFTYSHEEGTRAHGLTDDVPARVKRGRRNRIMALQRRLVARRQRGRVGAEVEVLIDGPSGDSCLVLQGRLEGQAPEIDPVVYLTDCDPTAYAPGSLVPARIVGARDYDLAARPLR